MGRFGNSGVAPKAAAGAAVQSGSPFACNAAFRARIRCFASGVKSKGNDVRAGVEAELFREEFMLMVGKSSISKVRRQDLTVQFNEGIRRVQRDDRRKGKGRARSGR